MIPGELFYQDGELTLNEGKEAITLSVTNAGDRAVQVGSHYHFFEVNRCLKFDRAKAYGRRLDIASGTAVRFEPGEMLEVQLILLDGRAEVYGLNALTEGKADPTDQAALAKAVEKAEQGGFADRSDEQI